jgi:hypothetical protein
MKPKGEVKNKYMEQIKKLKYMKSIISRNKNLEPETAYSELAAQDCITKPNLLPFRAALDLIWAVLGKR